MSVRYNYVCKECGFEMDLDLAIDDRDEPTKFICCEECGGMFRRTIGNKGGFRLKGNGWADDNYATHFGDTPGYKDSMKVGGK